MNAQQQTDLVDVDVMDYIRGKKIGLEVSSPLNNQTRGFRDRTTLLGSIVSSSPRYSKAPNFGYQLNPAAGGGATYAQHVSNNQANRKAAVYVGANAGMFHAFDGNPNANQGGGQELFAYVPRSVYPYLSELTNVNYTHRYFVDGPVVEGDVYFNGTWKTVVMGSAGAGPAGLFALDVTPTRPVRCDQGAVGHHAGRGAGSWEGDGLRATSAASRTARTPATMWRSFRTATRAPTTTPCCW